MARVACYIDGFNMFHALELLKKPSLKWLNLKALAKSFCGPNDTLEAVYYFTAIHTYDAKKCRRHKQYIDALRAVGVQVIISRFQNVDKFCRKNDRTCPFLEEKETDVALATHLLADAMENFMDRAILITADSDHVPVVKMIANRRPLIQLTLAAPPGRLNQARELGSVISDRKEISVGRIQTCIFPRAVYKDDGKVAANCPAAWTEIAA